MPSMSEDAIREQLLRQGHQLAQQHMQNLPRPSSRIPRSPAAPRASRPRDALPRTPNNVRPTRNALTGQLNTAPVTSPQIKSSASYQGQNYVPLPLVLPPALHQVLKGILPSNETFRQSFAVDVDGYFMRDLSIVANKKYGQAYHVDLIVQGIAVPASPLVLRQAIEAMAGWQSMTHRYGMS